MQFTQILSFLLFFYNIKLISTPFDFVFKHGFLMFDGFDLCLSILDFCFIFNTFVLIHQRNRISQSFLSFADLLLDLSYGVASLGQLEVNLLNGLGIWLVGAWKDIADVDCVGFASFE